MRDLIDACRMAAGCAAEAERQWRGISCDDAADNRAAERDYDRASEAAFDAGRDAVREVSESLDDAGRFAESLAFALSRASDGLLCLWEFDWKGAEERFEQAAVALERGKGRLAEHAA